MVIIVKNNKDPVISKNARMYQNENLVDRLVIYVAKDYQDCDISEFTAHLEYVNPGNQLKTELLTVAEEQDKKDYVKYLLPVTTELTKLAGAVKLYFGFTKVNEETMETQVLHTGTLHLEVLKWAGATAYVAPDGLSAIDQKLAETQAEIAKTKLIQTDYQALTPNDLSIDVNNRLHLMHDDAVIGRGVEISSQLNPTVDPETGEPIIPSVPNHDVVQSVEL